MIYMAKKRIAILFGGASKDYSTSLQSAYSVINALPREQYDIVPIGITRVGRWLFFPGDISEILDGTWEANSDCCSAVISPDPIHKGIIKIIDDGNFSLQRIDLVFSLLHGKYGESGKIQSLCKLSGIPFVGSDYEASVLCSDKILTHLMLNRLGIRTPRYYYMERVQLTELDYYVEDILEDFRFPLYVKAASCSQAIGASLVRDSEELKAAIKTAFSHHHKIIIEEAILGRELECIVFGNDYSLEATKIAEICPFVEKNNSKYINRKSYITVADIESAVKDNIVSWAKLAFKAFGCKNFAKFSFKLYNDTLYCSKISNLFGFTEANIAPLLLKESGYSYQEMLETILETASDNRS